MGPKPKNGSVPVQSTPLTKRHLNGGARSVVSIVITPPTTESQRVVPQEVPVPPPANGDVADGRDQAAWTHKVRVQINPRKTRSSDNAGDTASGDSTKAPQTEPPSLGRVGNGALRSFPIESEQPRFNPRSLPNGHLPVFHSRQTHDIVTSVCMFLLMPVAFVIMAVYLVMLCRYHSCLRAAVHIGLDILDGPLWSGPLRMLSEMAGLPVLIGAFVSAYYLMMFYFNSDVPGVQPPLPSISFKHGVRADRNYGFGLVLGFVCLLLYSVPGLIQFHADRIYSV